MADATNPANTIGNFLEACVSFIEIVVICYLRGGSEGEICIVCTPIQDSITSATFFHSSWARFFFRTKILFICKCESKRGELDTKGLKIERRAAGWAYVYDQSGWKWDVEWRSWFFSMMTCSQFRELAFCFFFWNIFCRLESSDSLKC